MADLNEILNKYNFKCKNCHTELTPDSAVEAVLVYGLIILSGEKDGFIGWSCPACNAQVTNLTQAAGNPFQFIGDIHNEIQDGIDSTLMYRSFPFSFSESKKDCAAKNGSLLYHNFEVINEFDFFPDFEPPHGKYQTFNYGSHAMGPAISIYWYDRSQIENLISLENEKQVRFFPRYEIYDHLSSKIDRLCWDNRTRFDFFGNELGSDAKKFNFNPERDIVQKPYEFLTILDIANSLDYGFYNNGETSSKLLLIGNGSALGSREIAFSKFDDFGAKTWPIFHSDWMQDILHSLAEDFITEYLAFVLKTDRNNEILLKLIECYTKKVYAAVAPGSRRKAIKKEAKINSEKRIIETEKCFPRVKIISDNQIINEIKIKIARTASLKIADSFLILGERGTGKEIFAKAFHEASKQKGPLIKVDCGAIAETLFESEIFGHLKGAFTGADRDRIGALGEATGGSVFFDEIGNMPLNLQPKLLRALQDRKYVPVGSSTEKPIDAKFIFATNRDLGKMVKNGFFKEDLYDRLKIPKITIPPLRERKEDIEILVKHFIKFFGDQGGHNFGELTVSKDCMKYLKSLDWPGNVRDIEKLIKDIMINRIGFQDRSEITEFDLPIEMGIKGNMDRPAEFRKKKLLGNTRITNEDLIYWMKELGSNKTRVAEKLGVTYKTIWLRCKNMGI